MSRDTNLFGAFIDGRRPGERPRVAGVALRPFSAWHHFQLQALDSPFVRRGEVRRFELLQALAVCRLRYPDSCLRMPVLRTIWPLRSGIRRAVSEFLDYTGSYLYRPEYAVVERKRAGEAPSEQITNAPELVRLIGDIIGWAPWPEAYVWDLPLGRAYWYQAMSFRARGVTLSYMNDEEREFQAEMTLKSGKLKAESGNPEDGGGKQDVQEGQDGESGELKAENAEQAARSPSSTLPATTSSPRCAPHPLFRWPPSRTSSPPRSLRKDEQGDSRTRTKDE